MNTDEKMVDLGVLGVIKLEAMEPYFTSEGFTVIMDGFTSTGIRVHGFVSEEDVLNSFIWRNALMIQLDSTK